LPTSGSGRVAFRYFVEDSGGGGANGDYIGIDRVVVDTGGGGPGLPNIAQTFAPGEIHAGTSSTLIVLLQNAATDDAALTEALTDALPDGISVATPSNATTSCPSGTVATTGNSVTLAQGATIPAGGACTLSVDVTATSPGIYTNALQAGALVTDAGSNVVESEATLVIDGSDEENGTLVASGLDHPLVDNSDGTSINLATGEIDDTGDVFGDMDVNFYDFGDTGGNLWGWGVNTNYTKLVVDDTGAIIVFHPGDEISATSRFSLGTGSPMNDEWLAGTDGYVGLVTACDGRLTFAVPSHVCYGYVHLTTTGPTGYPATLDGFALNGDGNPIVVPAQLGDDIFRDGFDGGNLAKRDVRIPGVSGKLAAQTLLRSLSRVVNALRTE
jgi:hypothetical protein